MVGQFVLVRFWCTQGAKQPLLFSGERTNRMVRFGL